MRTGLWMAALNHMVRLGKQKAHAWKSCDTVQVYSLDMAAWAFIKQFGEYTTKGMQLRQIYESLGFKGAVEGR